MPISWNEFEITDATVEQFESIPRHGAKAQDPQIVALLDDLEAGKIKEIRGQNETKLRGLRVTLGRGASSRGFRLEYRSDGHTLYIRKSDQPLKPKAASSHAAGGNGRRTRGRPRQEGQTNQELLVEGLSETME